MCSECLCVTRQYHCVPAGQQIPPDHSSEWALIPLGLFMSLPPLSTAAGWECGPGMLKDQTIRAPPPLIPTAATTHTFTGSPAKTLPAGYSKTVPTCPSFILTKTLPMPLLSYIPKLWLTSLKTHIPPCCQQYTSFHVHPALPPSPCLTCVCKPTSCLWWSACLRFSVKALGFLTLPALFGECCAPSWQVVTGISTPLHELNKMWTKKKTTTCVVFFLWIL